MNNGHQKALARLAIKDIDPDKEDYSLLGALALHPFFIDARTLKRRIEKGYYPNSRKEKGVTEEGDRYFIKGSDIISDIKIICGLK